VEREGGEQDMLASMELGLEVVLVVCRVENTVGYMILVVVDRVKNIAVGYIILVVVDREENIAMGYINRLGTGDQWLGLVLVVYRVENIAVGYIIRLVTWE
jgi:hypothetical protein